MNYILVTRKKDECFDFSEKLKASGFGVLHFPVIERVLDFDLDSFSNLINRDDKFSFIITSNYTLNFFKDSGVYNLLKDKDIEFFVLNDDIASKLSNLYKNSKCTVSVIKSGEGVAKCALESKNKIIYTGALKTSGSVESTFEQNNVKYSFFPVYSTKELGYPEQEISKLLIKTPCISPVFFSPSGVKAFINLFDKITKVTELNKVFAIGSTTKEACAQTFKEVITPSKSEIDSLYDVIVRELS